MGQLPRGHALGLGATGGCSANEKGRRDQCRFYRQSKGLAKRIPLVAGVGKKLEVTGHFLRGRRTTKSLLQERLEIPPGRFGFGGRRFDRRLLRGWIPDIHRLARDGFAGTGSLSFRSGERLIVKAREGNGAPVNG